MKKNLTTLLLSLLTLSIFSQDLRYEVHGKYSRPVKKERLNEAGFLSDFIAGYPVNWVTNYVSVEVLTSSNGNTMKAVSTDDRLSTEQKNILNTAELGTDIAVNVAHKYKNPVSGNIENREIHISMTVVPEVEAEYAGGYRQMMNYLRENAINKLSETVLTKLQNGIVLFTINEEGKVVNAKISKTSGDQKTDRVLVEAINKMPKWKPAENSKGIKVKQEFEFNIGSNNGC